MKPIIVFFSIEPTAFGATFPIQVMNIAAAHQRHKTPFNVYVTPTCDVTSNAESRSKIEKLNGSMYYDGDAVPSLPAEAAMLAFIEFLRSEGKKVVLVSYGHFFDCRKIVDMASTTGLLDELNDVVQHFTDLRLIYISKGFDFNNHLPYFITKHFDKSCLCECSNVTYTDEDVHSCIKRVQVFQKLIFEVSASVPSLTYDELTQCQAGIKTMQQIVEENREFADLLVATSESGRDDLMKQNAGFLKRF